VRGAISDAVGRSEAFRDFPAWVGTVSANLEGSQQNYIAGFIRIRGGQMLEILGRAGDQRSADQIYAAIRSTAALRDADKLQVESDRLRLKAAKTSATFATVWAQYPGQAITLEDAIILNGTRTTAQVTKGALLKTVTKGSGG
jgi:predicted Zn-dependent protease